MSYRDSKTATAREQVQLKFATRAAKVVNVFQCLIVSADAQRRQMFQQAASESGWKSFLCGDAPAALTALNRSIVQLAIVDLEAQHPATFHLVVEQITARSGLLLVVCGNEGNIDEEVWVRQLGAWLYLPGVPEGNSFTTLCGEARHIAERLWKANSPYREVGVTAAPSHRYS
jgi:ActR/RegA family two-component response regulator